MTAGAPRATRPEGVKESRRRGGPCYRAGETIRQTADYPSHASQNEIFRTFSAFSPTRQYVIA